MFLNPLYTNGVSKMALTSMSQQVNSSLIERDTFHSFHGRHRSIPATVYTYNFNDLISKQPKSSLTATAPSSCVTSHGPLAGYGSSRILTHSAFDTLTPVLDG